ncbi:YceI family protein [Nocardia sp. NPDC004260]
MRERSRGHRRPDHPRCHQAGHVDFELTSVQNDPTGALRVGFTGTTTINRKDWRVHWNPAAGTVASKATLEFDLAAIRQSLIQRKQPCLFTRQYSGGRARRSWVIRRPRATGSNPMRERQGHS